MFKKTLSALCLALGLAAALPAHEGHKEAGVFDPPHGGAIAQLADHWVEFYLEGDKAKLCMYEPDGAPVEDQHSPKNIVLKLSGSGVKSATLKAPSAKGGCSEWAFSTKAKLVKVDLSAIVDGKLAKAKLALEIKKK